MRSYPRSDLLLSDNVAGASFPISCASLKMSPGLPRLSSSSSSADGSGSPSRANLPLVQRHLYMGSVLTNRHAGAMNARLENGLQLSLELLRQQWCKRRVPRLAKIGNVALDLMLPFAPPEGAIGSTGFDGLEKFVAMVPHAQRNAIPCELVLRRIKVNRHQIFFLRWLSAQSSRGFQLPKFARRHLEFQFDLIAHLCQFQVTPTLLELAICRQGTKQFYETSVTWEPSIQIRPWVEAGAELRVAEGNCRLCQMQR